MRLGMLIRKWRTMLEREQVDVAAEIGILPRTLGRVEAGETVDGETLIKLLTWIMAPNGAKKGAENGNGESTHQS